MMLFSTLVPAIIIVGLGQLVVRHVRWRWLAYAVAIVPGGLLIYSGSVHLVLTGIEVAGVGCFVTWLDPFGYWPAYMGARDIRARRG